MLTNPAIKAYASMKPPEEDKAPRTKRGPMGLLSRSRRSEPKNDDSKLEPSERIQKYVTELRLKRKALYDARK